jgi:hypothetical protein
VNNLVSIVQQPKYQLAFSPVDDQAALDFDNVFGWNSGYSALMSRLSQQTVYFVGTVKWDQTALALDTEGTLFHDAADLSGDKGALQVGVVFDSSPAPWLDCGLGCANLSGNFFIGENTFDEPSRNAAYAAARPSSFGFDLLYDLATSMVNAIVVQCTDSIIGRFHNPLPLPSIEYNFPLSAFTRSHGTVTGRVRSIVRPRPALALSSEEWESLASQTE